MFIFQITGNLLIATPFGCLFGRFGQVYAPLGYFIFLRFSKWTPKFFKNLPSHHSIEATDMIDPLSQA
jgi:hypothetical protein